MSQKCQEKFQNPKRLKLQELVDIIEGRAPVNIGTVTPSRLSVATARRGTTLRRRGLVITIPMLNPTNAMIVITQTSVKIICQHTCSRNTPKLFQPFVRRERRNVKMLRQQLLQTLDPTPL